MTYLEKLSQVFAARTKGPWGSVCLDNLVYHFGGNLNCPTTIEDAKFIALTGSCADEMLAVVRAAQHEQDTRGVLTEAGIYDHSRACGGLRAALAALKAAVERG